MSNHDTIDVVHLEKYISGDDALRVEILDIFGEQAAILGQRFAEADTDDSWRNAAHSLKGAARGIGAWPLGDLCEQAEALIGEAPGKRERRVAMLFSIRRQISETLKEIERLKGVDLCA